MENAQILSFPEPHGRGSKKTYPQIRYTENRIGSVIHGVIHIIHRKKKNPELTDAAHRKTDVLVSSTKTDKKRRQRESFGFPHPDSHMILSDFHEAIASGRRNMV